MEQSVCFSEGLEEEALLRHENSESTLTAWFKLNTVDAYARNILYHKIPLEYRFKSKKSWVRRCSGNDQKVIGRMYMVSPLDGERYYLRLLLLHVKGACNYEDLKAHDTIQYSTFKEACLARGLLEDDQEWYKTMDEAVLIKMPKQLRELFCTICVFCNPSDIKTFYETYLDSLIEDYLYLHTNNRLLAIQETLKELEKYFFMHGKSCKAFGLPEPTNYIPEDFEKICCLKENIIGEQLYGKLNTDQKYAVDTVLQAVESGNDRNAFFLDGPGHYLTVCIIFSPFKL
jgi:hypothetical protein